LDREICRLQDTDPTTFKGDTAANRRELIISKVRLGNIRHGDLSGEVLPAVLNTVFPMGFQETEVINTLTEDERRKFAVLLLVDIFHILTKKRPQVVVIDSVYH